MKKFLPLTISIFSAVILFTSCAKEVVEDSDTLEKRVLEAYIKVVHRDSLQPTASGLYILRERIGDGAGVEDNSSIYVKYSVKDLSNNYSSTTYESLAKILGTYSKATYYGPALLQTGSYSIIKGVEEALKTMRVGGKIKAIVPSWLSDYGYEGSAKIHGSTTIYEIEVLSVYREIETFWTDTLNSYSLYKYNSQVDTSSNNYFYKRLTEGEGDTLKINDNVSIWYVGKLLDGFVFDTNIEDTARKYGIYSSTNSYAALSHTLTDTSSTDLVKGFEISLWRMSHGSKAITFFSPTLGYGAQQKSFGIYQPLTFYIYIEKSI